ncbi:MAG: sodium:solute symporter family protein [Gemmatimonadetes bacterium]|nr:sodium:solute symporter family protein [Gemmatimonadota bacterium]
MRAFYVGVVFAYLAVLVGVGIMFSRRVRTQEDFAVAGRRLTVPVLVLTLIATWIGSGSLFGGAGLAYRSGITQLYGAAGAWIGIVLLVFIAPRVRRFAQFTVPDILEARYNSAARVLATMVTVIAYTTIVSYQFRGGGKVLNLVAGIEPMTGMMLTAAFVITYTALAGMLSVAHTDVVNGSILCVGILVALVVMVVMLGGPGGVAERVPAHMFSLTAPGAVGLKGGLELFFPTLFLILGEANMYQKFFSSKSAGGARRAVVWWILGIVVVETGIALLAITGRAMYPGIDSESVIPYVTVHGVSPVIGGLLLAAMVAVIVSTADSFLLTPSTNIVRDIYKRFVNPGADDRTMLRMSRAVVVMLGLVAFAQVGFFPSILSAAYAAYTMYGAGITPALLAAFFWRRATTPGGVASISSGMAVTLAWKVWENRIGALPYGFDAQFPAIATSVLTLIVVSLLTRPDEKWKPFAAAAVVQSDAGAR